MRQPWKIIRGVPRRASNLENAVGAAIWQTPGGIQDELAKIDADFELFSHEFDAQIQQLGPRPYASSGAQDLAQLYDHVWTPFLRQWKAWYADHRGWTNNFWWNHAPTAEQYQKQLIEIRARAGKLGMAVQSPTPSPFGPSILFDPSHNIFDDTADAARHLPDVTKIAVMAACALGGVLILSKIGG